MNPIIAAIEQRRADLGMTRAALAERAGLDFGTVVDFRYQRAPRLVVAETLANTLGMRLTLEPIAAEPIEFVRRRPRA